MKIKVTSTYVDDQTKALHFYTEVLGFTKKADFSNGPYRWLTVASPEQPGVEIVLVGAKRDVVETIQLTGLDRSVTMQDPADV